jgi:hypothetical protein
MTDAMTADRDRLLRAAMTVSTISDHTFEPCAVCITTEEAKTVQHRALAWLDADALESLRRNWARVAWTLCLWMTDLMDQDNDSFRGLFLLQPCREARRERCPP